MDYNIELHKQLIREEAKQNQKVVYNKWINYVPQSSALVNNGRAFPYELLNTDCSMLLLAYLQYKSNWNQDEPLFRYCFREYYKLSSLLEMLRGKDSKLSNKTNIGKKLKQLLDTKYIEEQHNGLRLNNPYFLEESFITVNQDTLLELIMFRDELLLKVYLFYSWCAYRLETKPFENKDDMEKLGFFKCFDETLCNNINISFQSNNKRKLKTIRDKLQTHGFIIYDPSKKVIDYNTGTFKTTNYIKLLKF